jgi:ATP-dependent RNA helicase DDX51/DBP6
VANEDGEVSSKIDVLITTPGRLVEHVRTTPGFDLTWVKWLVIDEADRLLAQSFQEWVDVVIVGLEEAATKHNLERIAGVDLGDLGLRPRRREGEIVRKVVLSATMTRDVGKLAGLRLRKPKLVAVEDPPLPEGENVEMGDGLDEELEQFSVPVGLREHVTPVENVEYKPLYLMYLLRLQEIKTGALVFVKSNEGAARLARLLETVGEASSTSSPFTIGLVTGEMEKKRREKVLKRFSKGEVDLYILLSLSLSLSLSIIKKLH